MDAQEFFDQLAVFSDRYVKHAGLQSPISVWGYQEWKGDGPHGAILHYTADEDFHRVLRWFVRDKYQAKASSNVVVADGKMPYHDECCRGLPLIEELPATVVQVRRPENPSWHATWTNRECYGVEIVNAGELRQRDGEFVTWRKRGETADAWTDPWKPHIEKTPTFQYGRWWAPFNSEALDATVTVLRYVRELFGTLRKPWVLGHEAVQGVNTKGLDTDKRDPGPSFPIHGMRQAIFDDWRPVDRMVWFQNFKADHLDGQTWRDGTVIAWARGMADNPNADPTPEVAWKRWETHIESWADGDEEFWTTGRAALHLLGYYVAIERGNEPGGDTDEAVAIRVFQQLEGLTVDGQPGPITRRAIINRLVDRGIVA